MKIERSWGYLFLILTLSLFTWGIGKSEGISGNLLRNGGFEEGKAGWKFSSGVFLEEEGAPKGKRCVKLDTTLSKWEVPDRYTSYHRAQVDSSPIQVEPATFYNIKFWSKCTKYGRGYAPYLLIEWYRADMSKIRKPRYFLNTEKGTFHWKEFGKCVKAPEEAKYMTVSLVAWGDGMVVFFDDIEISKEEKGNLHLPSSLSYIIKDTSSYTIWYEDPTHKVFPEESLPGKESKVVILRAAVNEYEPFQLVISPKEEWKKFHLEFSDLEGKRGKISSKMISYRRVGYVPVRYQVGIGQETGLQPDPLIPDKEFDLEVGRNNPIWITVKVPEGTIPGEYRGRIGIYKGKRRVEEIDLKVKIWNFSLPSSPSLKGIVNVWSEYMMEGVEGVSKVEVFKRYAKNVRQHRLCGLVDIYPKPKVSIEKERVKVEWGKFEEVAEYCLDELGFEYFLMPGLGWFGGDMPWEEGRKWQGMVVFSDVANSILNPRFARLYPEAVGIISRYLEEKGWLDKSYAYVFDEPKRRKDPTIFVKLRKITALIKDVNPHIRMVQATFPQPELLDITDIWVTTTWHYMEHQDWCEKARKRGAQIWVYNNTEPIIGYPSIRVRIYPWMMWRYKAQGFWLWSINCWRSANPWETADSAGPKFNGKGSWVYPPRRADDPVPVDSIRWELLREGLEDYEYLHRLEEEMKRKREEGEYALASEAEEILKSVDTLFKGGFFSCRKKENYTHDIGKLREIREKMAEEIVKLSTS